MVIFDGITGRELVAPIDPCPDLPAGNRLLDLAMSDDGTRLAAAVFLRTESNAPQPGKSAFATVARAMKSAALKVRHTCPSLRSPADGSRLAVDYFERNPPTARASGKSGVKIWDTSTGELLQTLPLLPTDRSTTGSCGVPMARGCCGQSVSSETVKTRGRAIANGSKSWTWHPATHFGITSFPVIIEPAAGLGLEPGRQARW